MLESKKEQQKVEAFDRILEKGREDPKIIEICKKFYREVGAKYGIDEECKIPVQAFRKKDKG